MVGNEVRFQLISRGTDKRREGIQSFAERIGIEHPGKVLNLAEIWLPERNRFHNHFLLLGAACAARGANAHGSDRNPAAASDHSPQNHDLFELHSASVDREIHPRSIPHEPIPHFVMCLTRNRTAVDSDNRVSWADTAFARR